MTTLDEYRRVGNLHASVGERVGVLLLDAADDIARLRAAIATFLEVATRHDTTIDAETADRWMDEYEVALDALRAALRGGDGA